LKLVRAVLPYMRARKSGIIATMGSLGGWRGHPVAGIYCASKHAVAALTEALKNEVAHLGIDVVTIEPGYFRTAFLTGGHRVTAFRQIDDLIPITSKWTAVFDAVVGKQPGDPAKGAQVIVEALTGSGRCEGRELPARLALGSDAVPAMTEILRTRQVDLDRWADVVTCTDCDDDGT